MRNTFPVEGFLDGGESGADLHEFPGVATTARAGATWMASSRPAHARRPMFSAFDRTRRMVIGRIQQDLSALGPYCPS